MNELIAQMEQEAYENDVPIMQQEGIEFLSDLIVRKNVQNILEIGTAIGYSAIRMALLNSNIKIVSIEKDEIRYHQALKNVARAGLNNQIKLIHGDALLTQIQGKYDLIFIDAAKAQYIKFFEKYSINLDPKGIIVSDNLKFHGMIDNIEKINNRNTRQLVKKIMKYREFLETNILYQSEFYDVGDGIAVTSLRKSIFNQEIK